MLPPKKRVISVFVLAMLNVSIMASLRNLPLVAEFGLGSIFFFLLVALFFLLPCALIAAELATAWPIEGGVYVWVREAFGDRWGFVAIWMQWVHNVAWYPAILSFVAVTATYIFSPELASDKTFVISVVLGGFWGMTLLNYLGIRTSAWFSTAGVLLGTVAPGILIISLGIQWMISGSPLQISFSSSALIPSFEGIGNFVFLGGLFLAFAGLEVTAGYASNVINPKRNYPKAILLGAIITFALFLLGSLSIAVVIPKTQISLVQGVMDACAIFLDKYGLISWLPLIAALMILGAVAEINSWIIGPVRGLFATAYHGNLPPFLQKRNQWQVPTRLLFFQACLVSIVSLIFLYVPNVNSGFWMLTALSAQSYLVMYILMFMAAIKLRYSKPKTLRPYVIPGKKMGMWILALMGIGASCFAILISFIPPTQLKVENTISYVLLLASGFIAMVALPLLIHLFRKPRWILK